MYVAALWLLFGKTLVVSHWSMLPFLLILVVQWFKLGRRLVGKSLLPYFMLYLMIDPVIASQASLVSPDLVLAACFLLLVNSVYEGAKNMHILSVIGLGMISTRGMMVAFLVFIWQYFFIRRRRESQARLAHIVDVLYPYLPGGMMASLYLVYHYWATAWIGYHANSEWAPSFAFADIQQVLKNGIVLIWRLLDFGRLFLVGGILFMIWILWNRNSLIKGLIDPQLKKVWALLVILLIGLGFSFLIYAGLQQHRYLIPVYLSLTLLFFLIIKELPSDRWTPKLKSLFVGGVAVGLLTGNLWIYPDRISQGWDSTLAHWPFFELRSQMLAYINTSEIPLEEIGTAFPEIGAVKFKNLSEDLSGFKAKDMQTDKFILYSNIMNDYSDTELWRLREEWEVLHEIRKRGVKMILYRRPE
mgnify:CR=1 FL=1